MNYSESLSPQPESESFDLQTLQTQANPLKLAQSEPTHSTSINHSISQRSVNQLNIGGTLILLLIIAGLMLWFIKSFLKICNPNEILILSGRKHRTQSGQEVGYRVKFGGRVIVIPILETVKRMNLTVMPVPVEVSNAYSKGGTPLDIQAIANVKISSDRRVVGNAIERFLDRNRNEIKRVARETLEGNLRGVVATLTPEEINEDRLQFAERIAHTKAKIVCTRKTTPGHRAVEKRAVRCGGGTSHRYGLDDAILIKDNHIAACGSIPAALERAHAYAGHLRMIEIEVDTIDQLKIALPHKPHAVLLDNMPPETLRTAVALIDGQCLAEASGGITLDTVAAKAETGVDYISSGALTHSAINLDVGLDIL